MAIPYYNEARGHAACNMYVQLSLYVESEITNLVPLALSSFHYLQAVATESCTVKNRVLCYTPRAHRHPNFFKVSNNWDA